MADPTEPILDSEEGDYAAMSSFDCSDGFTPSLPTLINRPTDSDAQSVSDIESISNGETVSDTTDGVDVEGFEMVSNPDIHNDTYEPQQEEDCSDEDMEEITMSNRTITPSRPSIAHIMSSPSPCLSPSPSRGQYSVKGFYMSEKPYESPGSPLRLLFVGDAATNNVAKASIIAKLVTSITGDASDGEKITKSPHKFNHDDADLKSLSMPVQVSHIVNFDRQSLFLESKGGKKLRAQDVRADFAILYHYGLDDINTLVPLAHVLSVFKTPLVEISAKEGFQKCTISRTSQGHHFLRSRWTPDEEEGTASALDVPISQKAFLALNDDELSRHLAYISSSPRDAPLDLDDDASKLEGGEVTDKDPDSPEPWSFDFSHVIRNGLKITFGLIALFVLQDAICFVATPALDPLSDFTARAPQLQTALTKSGLASVNATDVLRYPTTTAIVGSSTTSGLAFPTAASVHVVKPDQLLVSLPNSYRDTSFGLLKNGKTLTNVNATRLISGVYSLSLPSSDAHGQVQVSILSLDKAATNETIKVDLGHRFLQRVTYEKVAKGVQQPVSDAGNAAKLYQARVVSDVHFALNHSVSSFKSFRAILVDVFQSTNHLMANQTVNGLGYVTGLTYNTSSAVGSFALSAIPRKRHVNRARINLLKIRTRVMGSSRIKRVPERKPSSVVDQVKQMIAKAPSYFGLNVEGAQKSTPLLRAGKDSSKVTQVLVKDKTCKAEPNVKKSK